MAGRPLKDYTGETHGCWYVIERDFNPQSKSHETFWKCQCQNCRNIASVRKGDLDRNPRSCNNCKGQTVRQTLEERGLTKNPIHIGDRFGMLTIIGPADKEYRGKKGYWKCKCDCGNIVHVRTEHLIGKKKDGYISRTISCGCSQISSGELKIKQLLDEAQVPYKYQYRAESLKQYPFDFAIFNDDGSIKKLIEYNGGQHYKPVEFFGGEETFERQKERDKIKRDWCKENGIELVVIPYWDYEKINLNMLI